MALRSPAPFRVPSTRETLVKADCDKRYLAEPLLNLPHSRAAPGQSADENITRS
jgi:hypothetical protein